MKHRKLTAILCAEAAVCVLTAAVGLPLTLEYFSFPFSQLASGLRILSLSGTGGNIAAVIIYVCVSLFPLIPLVLRAYRGRLALCDLLLVILSILLFFSLYMMINPAYLAALFGWPDIRAVAFACLSGTIYSVLAAYIVFRLLELFDRSSADKLLIFLKVLLELICALLVFSIFYIEFSVLVAAHTSGHGAPLPLFLIFLTDCVPETASILIIFLALTLIDELRTDRYGTAAVVAADALARTCRRALSATVLSCVAVNLLQLLFSEFLMNVDYSVNLPLSSIALVLSVMLLARWFAEGHRLKADNDLFI